MSTYNQQKLTNIMKMMYNLNDYEDKMELKESKHQLNRIQTMDVQSFEKEKKISETIPVIYYCQMAGIIGSNALLICFKLTYEC